LKFWNERNRKMTEREKLAMLEDMMDLNEGELEADMCLDDVEGWDSMAKLSLIVLMDDEFGRVITAEQIRSLKNVKDILDLMN